MQSHCERDQIGQEEKTEKATSSQSCLNSQEPLFSFYAHAHGKPTLTFRYFSEFLPPAAKSDLE